MQYLLKPWDHQRIAEGRAAELYYFAFLFEMGCGKTGALINTWRRKAIQRNKFLRTLIFCPPLVIANWKDEFAKHSKVPPEKIHLLDMDGRTRCKLFDKHRDEDAVFVTNYEGLLMPELFERFRAWKPQALTYDECHLLKDYSTRRSKLADILANPQTPAGTHIKGLKPLTYILSGSPVLNSPMDLFQQYKIMDGGLTFGANFLIFRARYFYDANAGMKGQRKFEDWQVIPECVEELNRLLHLYGMRVTKADCLDLPEEVSVTIECGMTSEQTRNYREMKNDYITFVDAQSATVDLAITKALRLAQIASGFLPLECTGQEGDVARIVYAGTPKEAALRQLLEQICPSSQVLVWAVWQENYKVIRRVCEELGLPYVEVTGMVSRAKQKQAILDFQNDPRKKVFIGNPKSGGVGINLTQAPYSIFYSRNFSLADWLQARSRNHRGGQTNKVTHYDLVCSNTMDALAQVSLISKNEMSESLLRNLAEQERVQVLS